MRRWGAEARVGLSTVDVKHQTRIDVSEICVIEDVVNLPTQLQRACLTHRNVLEERDVVVEDRRHAQRIARHVADVPQLSRPRKATDVDYVRRSGRVGATDVAHRIADRIRSRIDLAAGDIRYATVIGHRNVLRLAAGIGSGSGNLPVIEYRPDETVVQLAAQLWHVVDVVDRQDVGLIEVRRRVVELLVGRPKFTSDESSLA